MGLVSIELSGALWQDIMTVGWKAGDGRIVECTEGLPEDAVCKSVFYKQWPATSNLTSAPAPSLVFVFEHEDFDDIELGAPIPMMSVVHQVYS